MNQLEANIMESFGKVKQDITQLQSTLQVLAKNQERMMEWIQDTRDKEIHLYHRINQLKEKADSLGKRK